MYSQRIPPSPVILHSPEEQDWYMASHSPVTRVLLFSSRKKHTPKSLPVGIYDTFVGSKWTKITPRGHPIALCLGLAKTAQTIEHLEHLGTLPKQVFEGVSFEASVEKGQPSNTSNGLGIQRGKGGRGSVRWHGGGASGKIKGLRYKARYGDRSVRNKETSMQQDLLT